MSESTQPSITDILAWLDEAAGLTIITEGEKADHRRAIWTLLKSVFEPGSAERPGFNPRKARWILGLVNYVTLGAKHPKRTQSAVLEIARGAKPAVVAHALGRSRTTFSRQSMYEFKARMADRIIAGLGQDHGVVPGEDGVSFQFAF